MSEIKHPSLKAELLYLIGRASTPLSSAELYERYEMADEIVQVAKAVANLQSDGKIVRTPGDGRARYTLADGVAAPAPAGKHGRSKAVQADDAADKPVACIRQAAHPALPGMEIPTLGDPVAKALDLVEARVSVAGREVDAGKVADALLSKTRAQIVNPGARWAIDQAGGVSVYGATGTVSLSPVQALMLAEMTLAMHDVLERRA